MIKGFLPILYTSAGVTAAGVAGYAIVSPQLEEPVEPVAIIQTQPETTAALVPETKSEEPVIEAPAIEKINPPVFTLLRVEKDGSTVIAGTGPGNSEVTLLDGDVEISKTRAGPEGDFAFVLDKPLSPGIHKLFLIAKPDDGDAIVSAEAGIINVPELEADEEATVLVSQSGQATRILQKPKERKLAQASEEVELAPKKITEPDPVVEPEPVPSPVTETRPVLIEAADIENDKIFIAGTGEPGTSINIYLENQLLGSAKVGENGAFLFEGRKNIEPGKYSIRADMVDAEESKVVARAEVRLIHEPKVVADAPKPQVKPEVPKVEETAELQEPELDTIKEIRTGSAVIIRRGDNLWTVADRNYGSGYRYTTIFEANRDQVRDPDLIYPGQVLKVPENQQTNTDNSG